MRNSHWIFDFDGTLIDSAPAIMTSYAAALNESGIAPAIPLHTRLIGPPLNETLIRISGSNDATLIRELSERFKKHYDRDGVLNTTAYPGITLMLEQLSRIGIILHIATNKRLSVTLSILEHLGWKQHFTSIYALDMCEPRLPDKGSLLRKQLAELNLSPENTCYIGDKQEDGLAAEANGLPFHYASWGYGDLSPRDLPPAWHWLENPQHLLHALPKHPEMSKP